MTFPPQRGDDAGLLRRRDTAKHVGFVELGQQRLVRQMRELRTVQHAGDRDAELAADVPGHLFIVAGHDFQRNAKLIKSRQRIARAGLRRIEESQIAAEDQILLVGDVSVLTFCLDVAPGHAQEPVALSAQFLECRLGSVARGGIEGARRRSLLLEPGREREHVFRRALDDDASPAVFFNKHRDPAALEIERNLVDLAA